MTYDKQWLIELLQHLGYAREAEEAARVLPDRPSQEEVFRFADEHGITRDELTDRMGGSP